MEKFNGFLNQHIPFRDAPTPTPVATRRPVDRLRCVPVSAAVLNKAVREERRR